MCVRLIKHSKWLIPGIGILISVILLWFAFRNLNPEQVWTYIQQANGLLLGAGVVWYFAAVSVITLRWKFLLNALRRLSVRQLFPLVCIGYAGNNVYPFRSGELLRIVLLQSNYAVPFARATTTVIVERVFDGLVMLTFILISLLVSDVPSQEVRLVASAAAPLFLTALLIFFALAARPDLLRRLYQRVSGPLPEQVRTVTANLVEEVITGLDGLRSPADLAGTITSSYVTWALEASVYWIVSMAFNLQTSYFTMLLVVGVVNLAGLIPASPGQFGVFETFASAVLIGAGVSQAQSVAFALTIHMVIWLPVTLVGLYFLLQQGLSFSAISRARQLEHNSAS